MSHPTTIFRSSLVPPPHPTILVRLPIINQINKSLQMSQCSRLTAPGPVESQVRRKHSHENSQHAIDNQPRVHHIKLESALEHHAIRVHLRPIFSILNRNRRKQALPDNPMQQRLRNKLRSILPARDSRPNRIRRQLRPRRFSFSFLAVRLAPDALVSGQTNQQLYTVKRNSLASLDEADEEHAEDSLGCIREFGGSKIAAIRIRGERQRHVVPRTGAFACRPVKA
ncbi:uncharacterized protein N7529_000702 [Penicillium soppii]|uniref:uncharacterized protein n=1 Tax=Penicillium soppii TaxID=69789 RepID=UPI002547AD8D|nr:uncharacterized protein N7529_000702 [Penicillium soppii]KAJ5882030.1 hypothetical protein N7529_000702 [Penicillium soppii]